jgi:hypothetical protein
MIEELSVYHSSGWTQELIICVENVSKLTADSKCEPIGVFTPAWLSFFVFPDVH